MATRRFVFGKPPFRLLADHLAQDRDFVEDAQRILKLDEDGYLRLATQLAKADTFLSRSDLTVIVAEALGEDADEIAAIIHRLSGIVHDAEMDVIDAMDALGNAIKEKATSFEPEQRQTLADRLQKLVAEPIGIAKQYKARQLAEAIGAQLDDFRIICDIRPIFDQKRERIEGAIPLAILRLEYSDPDGESGVVELYVTERQLQKLAERIADAGIKLRLMKEVLARQDIAVPKTKATVAEDES
ncbi:MAG: hypothetical protein PHO07_01945 [Pirellulales bacterium]|jgi:hypothetical protein|nr:hypothetical protein [Thermoguttaceae bacterium]MDD4785908.1 hypothetical protein [Pirellulales bacterium]NLZ00978.1 phosphoenolpyruvate carboxylase [Pirellulaceae bacterium]